MHNESCDKENVDVNKTRALYEYLLKFAKLRQHNAISLSGCRHKSISDIEKIDDPVNIKINYCDTVSDADETGDPDPLLVISKPAFEKCPPPPEGLSQWLKTGWNSYCCDAVTYPAIHKKTGLPVIGEAESDDVEDEIVYFEDDLNRVESYRRWMKRRIEWVDRQKRINQTRLLFDAFYDFHMDMRRDSENLELVVANGFFECAKRPGVSYPILSKRVRTKFMPRENKIYVYDDDAAPDLYTDIFEEFRDLNLDQVSGLKDSLALKGYHPLDRNETPSFLTEVINVLTSKGGYFKSVPSENWKTTYEYACYWRPLYLLRPRPDGSAKIIQQIIDNINEKGYVPKHIAEIVNPGKVEDIKDDHEESFVEKLASVGGESSEILLAKEANREQLEIAKRIERYNAVVVQGPPGTGKTHTIANLLGHFLSQGKSVLVTSHTTKALAVLKEKVPEDIQPLCVSVIDDDKAEMTRSVNGITGWMSKISSDKLKDQMDALKEQRDDVLKELSQLRHKLFSIKNIECQTIAYNGESLSPSQAADYVSKNESVLAYIPGQVATGQPLPLTINELIALYRSNVEVSTDEVRELERGLPNPSEILSPDDFDEALKISKRFQDQLSLLLSENQWTYSCDSTAKTISIATTTGYVSLLAPTQDALDRLLSVAEKISELKPWMKHAAIDGKDKNGRRKWQVLIDRIEELCELSDAVELDSFGKEIAIPDMDVVAREQFLADIKAMHEFVSTGGTIGKFKMLVNPRWKRSMSAVTINGANLSSDDDFKLVIGIFNLRQKRVECARYWDQLIKTAGAASFFNLDTSKPEKIAKNFVPLIKRYIDWYSTDYQPLNAALAELQIDRESFFDFTPLDSELDRTDKIFSCVFNKVKPIVLACRCLLSLQEVDDRLSGLKRKLSAGNRDGSIICMKIRSAVESRDSAEYREAFLVLKEAYEKYDILSRRKDLLGKLAPLAPDWARAIRMRDGVHGQGAVPETIADAWRWKQYSAILNDLFSEDYEALQKRISFLANDYRKLTAKYIAASSWYHLIKRTESDHGLKASLVGWANTVAKIGKTNSPRSVLIRQKARELMTKCQRAVPAWVMPLSKAMTSLNPAENVFDVIIVDEASQADITSLAIAYMAKKMIVVGDDKQVTPESPGIPFAKVQSLIATYLQGQVANAQLYDERSSLYGIAGTTYDTLMLSEHFRCVPEIIGFSNMLSYDNQIKPLRDPTTSNLLPHVVNFRVSDGVRQNRTNVEEAKMLVALMKSCIEQPEYEGKTFGAITMLGNEQSVLIQQLITEHIALRDIEERRILCGEPPNFQGDERDVVFMSLVESHRDTGPLPCVKADSNMNQQRKRYNVAASRPKDQLWIVNSLDHANDLQDGDIRKLLIEYAMDPASFVAKKKAVVERTESPFEVDVAKALIARGYHLEPQWSVGAYRIDFVVICKGNKVALECDGERFHHTEEEIRSDMERQQILERLGWRFIRLRGSEYYRNKEKAIDRIAVDLHEFGIEPETWEASVNGVARDSELLQRIKTRAAAILCEWKDAETALRKTEQDVVAQKNCRQQKRKVVQPQSLFNFDNP